METASTTNSLPCRYPPRGIASNSLHSGLRRVVIAAFGHKAFGLDLDDGELTFARDLPQPWHASRGGKAAYRNPYASPAFTGRGTSLLCSAESVLCLDPSGRTLWQTELSAEINAFPVVADHPGLVAVATVAGQCHLLDLADGVQRGAVRLDAKVTSSGACSGDVLALGTSSGAVFGIDLRTARVLWRDGFGAPTTRLACATGPNGAASSSGLKPMSRAASRRAPMAGGRSPSRTCTAYCTSSVTP